MSPHTMTHAIGVLALLWCAYLSVRVASLECSASGGTMTVVYELQPFATIKTCKEVGK